MLYLICSYTRVPLQVVPIMFVRGCETKQQMVRGYCKNVVVRCRCIRMRNKTMIGRKEAQQM